MSGTAAARAMTGAGARIAAGQLPVARLAGRTLIVGDDLDQPLPYINSLAPQPGMHDVWIHARTPDSKSWTMERGKS
jgi:hypothetical protein